MNAAGISAAVERRIQEQHGKIIGGVFSVLIQRHNAFCGCEYCIVLKDYTEYKMAVHRYYRRFLADGVLSMQEEAKIYGGLRKLRAKAECLKAQKDAMKYEALKLIA